MRHCQLHGQFDSSIRFLEEFELLRRAIAEGGILMNQSGRCLAFANRRREYREHEVFEFARYQPTMRREKRSISVAKYSKTPPHNGVVETIWRPPLD
jgi:hypothetical protein